ncbi:hypothetical protein SAMN05444159_4771 [Bradyrhizobium lablabi]|uniref:Uncharacterized protein n=1 Tax=Bradyrhizobium lablabi TaxID=722472 RepID=A0A1M6X5R7_9BRAD|nr:hypothetical protein SAMN05444159_4771 [Bradyrhizobium lablabi]
MDWPSGPKVDLILPFEPTAFAYMNGKVIEATKELAHSVTARKFLRVGITFSPCYNPCPKLPGCGVT